jgi:hypothetical protein
MAQAPNNSLITEIMALKKASLEEIKAKYAEVFGQDTPASNNKIFLWRKIAYRLQENQYGQSQSQKPVKETHRPATDAYPSPARS